MTCAAWIRGASIAAVAAALAWAGATAGGCGNKDSGTDRAAPEPGAADQPAPAPPDQPVASPGGGGDPGGRPDPAPADGPAFDPALQRIAEGTSCAGHGEQVTDATSAGSFERAGTVWSRSEFWGCGCPEGPEFTLVYEPGTSPLAIRLCHDDARDPCEAGCRQTLVWDLGPTLRAANATDVTFRDR